MNLLKITFTLLFLSFPSTKLFAQTKPIQFQSSVDEYLQIINQKKSFSGEVLIAIGKETLYHKAIGLASYKDSVPLNKGSMYRIASITKTFTGTLIAKAHERNKIDYNDKVGRYIPELSEELGQLTIHQLLTHTSGLPHNEGIKNYWSEKSKVEMTTERVIDEINQLSLLFEPGTDMKYSSLGYYMLGTVIERVYGDDYQAVLNKHILQPLEMKKSGAGKPSDLVMAHHLLRDRMLPAPYRNYSMLKGAGDMYATAKDLLKWCNSFYSTGLLTDTSLKAVLNEALPYSYGWFTDKTAPVKYYHGGGTWGYSSYMAIYPQEKISIIILSNVSTLPVKAIGADVERMVYGMAFEMPQIQESIVLDAETLKQYAGTYESETSTMRLQILKEGNTLFAKMGTNPPFQIYAKGDHEFFGKKIEVTLRFKPGVNTIEGVEATRMGRSFKFKKQR